MPTKQKHVSKEDNAAQSTSKAAKRNVKVIAQLENTALHERSLMNRVSDGITRFAGSGTFVASRPTDILAWAGRIIDRNRIDGLWQQGRWDLRRSGTIESSLRQ
jgi:uncharacterized membrane protein